MLVSRRMVHTVDLFAEIRNGHDNWHWATLPYDPSAEIVYSRPELLKVLRVYALCVSRMTGGAHIRITSRGRFSGRWLAEWQWAAHMPLGEPWVHWPAWENLCFTAKMSVPRYAEHDEYRLVQTGPTDVTALRDRFTA